MVTSLVSSSADKVVSHCLSSIGSVLLGREVVRALI
jgi:hypothetical protein